MFVAQHHLTILTGASRGMGLAMAQQLLSPDCVLLCISRHTHEGLSRRAHTQGAHLEQWCQDLANTQEATERLERWLLSLHAPTLASATLINNACAIPAIGPLSDCPVDDLTTALRVGLEAPMLLTGAFVRATQQWVDQGWTGPRKVLNISSGLGRRAMAAQGPYCAIKAGLDHFSRCLALEEALRPQGVQVVSLAPGVIDTDMQLQLRTTPVQHFPDQPRFADLHAQGLLTSPGTAATRVLNYLHRADFGQTVVADVREETA
jgi:benzil reductase ((S)-benzoin forming)